MHQIIQDYPTRVSYLIKEARSLEKQVNMLVSALEHIRDDFAPWTGEDARGMMDAAHDALVEWERTRNGP